VTLEKKYRNFDEMMKEQLVGISNIEVCDPHSDDSVELEELVDTKQYVPWRLKYQHYCWHQYNLEGVPYSYVIRDKVPPPKYNTLMEELIYLLPVDMGNAQFWADSNLVFSYLESAIKAETA